MAEKLVRNFDAPAADCTGMPITEVVGGKQTTWSALLASIVKQRYRGEEGMDWKAILERGELARRISVGGDVELTVEEVAELKRIVERCGAAHGHAAAVLKILEG